VHRVQLGQQLLVGEVRERDGQPRPGRQRRHVLRGQFRCPVGGQEVRDGREDHAGRPRQVDDAPEHRLGEHGFGIEQVPPGMAASPSPVASSARACETTTGSLST
jgi:hypothetical protein